MDLPFPKKSWEKQEWDQIKNLTKDAIVSLLKKDVRWEFRGGSGGRLVFHNPKLPSPYENLAIHYHAGEGFRNKGLLKGILNQWCCTREDLIKWKILR